MIGRGDLNDQTARRAAIRRIIRTQRVSTQEALRELLAEAGFEVTQATLSRDLARLAARRVSLPEGGTAYELDGAQVTASEEALLEVGHLVTSIDDNGTLVVIQTTVGAASAVARAIDLSRMPEALGSLAGDDTIFIAPGRGVSSRTLVKKLHKLFGKG